MLPVPFADSNYTVLLTSADEPRTLFVRNITRTSFEVGVSSAEGVSSIFNVHWAVFRGIGPVGSTGTCVTTIC
jgi:hypothetical protein